MIGAVGQMLADHDINIAQYAQARLQAQGEALACAVLDAWVDAELREKLGALPSVRTLRVVKLD